jgi:hypothetical protein
LDLSYLVPTSDGGVLIGNKSGTLLRLDKNGQIVWGKQYRHLYATTAFELEDRSIIIIGAARIARLDPGGEPISITHFTHPPDSPLIPAPPFYEIDSLHKMTDGTVIAAGINGGIMTIDSQGQLISLKLPDAHIGYGRVTWIGDDGSWHGGWSEKANWVERKGTDGLGWRRRIIAGENVFVATRPLFLIGTQDGGALFGSYRRDYDIDPEPKLWLIRFDQNGEVGWQYTYDIGPGNVRAYETRDGGFVFAGWGGYYFQESVSDLEGYLRLARIGPSGELEWSKIYGNGRSLPLVTEIQESSEGAIILSGNLGTFDGEQITRRSDLVVMKIGTGGEFIDCNLMQDWPLTAPQATIHQIVELYAEPYQILETEVLSSQSTNEPTHQDLEFNLIQPCLRIQPTPTPAPTQIPITPKADGNVWIVGGNGIVLGSFDGNSWMQATTPNSLPEPGTPFDLFLSQAKYIGETLRYGDNFIEKPGCLQIELTQEFTGIPTLGISAGWQILPDEPLWANLDSPFYTAAILDHLAAAGITDPTISLTNVLRIDFEGDGIEEALISANYSVSRAGDTIDGSLILLRRVIGNEILTSQLLPAELLTNGSWSSFRIFGLFDLDGDGDLEIVIEGYLDSQPGTWIFDTNNDGYVEVLSVECGLQEWPE